MEILTSISRMARYSMVILARGTITRLSVRLRWRRMNVGLPARTSRWAKVRSMRTHSASSPDLRKPLTMSTSTTHSSPTLPVPAKSTRLQMIGQPSAPPPHSIAPPPQTPAPNCTVTIKPAHLERCSRSKAPASSRSTRSANPRSGR